MVPRDALLRRVGAPAALLEVELGEEGRVGGRGVGGEEERADGVAERGEGGEGGAGQDHGHGDD